MKPLVLFGVGAVARMAQYLWTVDSPREVVACTVDREFMPGETRFGLPVVPFDDVTNRYPPSDFDLFVAVGYSRMNRFRAERFRQAKDLGMVDELGGLEKAIAHAAATAKLPADGFNVRVFPATRTLSDILSGNNP